MERLTIHNPYNDAHFMRIKPVSGAVRVTRGDRVLAQSAKAIRVMETGRDVYDPVIYIPSGDVSDALHAVPGKTTHCPLKGDASYFALDGEEIAWTYGEPFDWAHELAGHVGFYAGKVTIEEKGPGA
ncbi:DUF427 domain-containing protein [Oricola sp.]|uniref:DUF427 domain-containing protein n=1 Tax=Oricola sp. TaxID=1979950 RepID=UPI003BA94B93